MLADGAWVDVRKPGALIHSQATKAGEDAWWVYVSKCVIAWSYDDPISEEAIGNLTSSDIAQIVDVIIAAPDSDNLKNSKRRSTSH